MMPFDEKYSEIHARIQEDRDLVRILFGLAREKGIINPFDGKVKDGNLIKPPTYFPCGSIEGICLGLNLNSDHVLLNFPRILANMRLVYEVSEGKADLSKVCALLVSDEKESYSEIGLVSEDMSCDGRYGVTDLAGINYESRDLNWLWNIFDEGMDGIYRTCFHVFDPNTPVAKGIGSLSELRKPIRTPIVDLDHLSQISPKYLELHKQYCQQYETDTRFRIREL